MVGLWLARTSRDHPPIGGYPFERASWTDRTRTKACAGIFTLAERETCRNNACERLRSISTNSPIVHALTFQWLDFETCMTIIIWVHFLLSAPLRNTFQRGQHEPASTDAFPTHRRVLLHFLADSKYSRVHGDQFDREGWNRDCRKNNGVGI